MQLLVRDLNRLYRTSPALHRCDFGWQGFEWIDCHDSEHSVLAYLRKGNDDEIAIVVVNFTPVPRYGYRIGLPRQGGYQEVLNSDSRYYGGSDLGNGARLLEAEELPWMNRPYSLALTLPPLSGIVLRFTGASL
jgi:1,4-alpha-glucan branching enzyme